MKNALMVLLAVVVVVSPYILVTLGVYILAGVGWAMIVLGCLILLSVAAVYGLKQQAG